MAKVYLEVANSPFYNLYLEIVMKTMRWYVRELRSELIAVIFFMLAVLLPPLAWSATTCVGKVNPPLVPVGALWPTKTIFQPGPPATYTTPHLVVWFNAVTALECVSKGERQTTVEFTELSITELRADGTQVVVKRFPTDPNRTDLVSQVFQRKDANGENWFGAYSDGIPTYPPIGAGFIETWTGRSMIGNLARIDLPYGIYHGWTEPRAPIAPDSQVRVKACFKTQGSARGQIGADWYSDLWSPPVWSRDCSTSQCELGVSNWVNTNGAVQCVSLPN